MNDYFIFLRSIFILTIIFITIVGGLSLSFLGKKFLQIVVLSLFCFNTVSADSFNQLILEGMKIGENFTKYVDEPTIKATNMENFKNNKYSVSGFTIDIKALG